ncbi:MAG TPA: hypothetical protein DIW31_04830 [Bacteroidales bacterium]|nr:hypothetical protein [Bacteroidales bacterium]
MSLIDKKHRIELDEKLIGFSFLENADAPMGVVSGMIQFENIDSGYDLFLDYCSNNRITINENDTNYKFIDTQTIPGLKVYCENGSQIKGVCAITGMDKEGFEIQIMVNYPLYEEIFPHHVKEYSEKFK